MESGTNQGDPPIWTVAGPPRNLGDSQLPVAVLFDLRQPDKRLSPVISERPPCTRTIASDHHRGHRPLGGLSPWIVVRVGGDDAESWHAVVR